jgi:hypothetical protein
MGSNISLVSSTGNVSFGNANIAGTANITTANISTLSMGSNISLASNTGNVSFGNANIAGLANIGNIYVNPSGSISIGIISIYGNGIISGAQVEGSSTFTTANITTLANIANIVMPQGGNITLGNMVIYGNGTIYDVSGNIFIANANIITANIGNMTVTGTANIRTGNITIANITNTTITGTANIANLIVTGNSNIGTDPTDYISLLGTTTIGNASSVSSGNILTIYGNATFSNIGYHNQLNEKVATSSISIGNITMDYNQSAILYLNNTGTSGTTGTGNTNLIINNIPNTTDSNRSYVFTIVGNHYGGMVTNLYLNGTAASNKKPIYFNGGNATVMASFPFTFTNYYDNVMTVQQIGLVGNINANANIALSSVSFFTS